MTHKVLFHLDELKSWNILLANLENLTNALDDLDLKVVINGEGVKYLSSKESLDQKEDKLKELAEKGAQFLVCKNALKTHKVEEEDLYSFVGTVPAGVVTIIEFQEEGYSYIKP